MTWDEDESRERGKQTEDGVPPSGREAADVAAEVAILSAQEDSDDQEILRRLGVLAARYSVDEIFAVMVRYDTPDLLG